MAISQLLGFLGKGWFLALVSAFLYVTVNGFLETCFKLFKASTAIGKFFIDEENLAK
jgi:hypothetical protein